MTELVDRLKKLLEDCTYEEQISLLDYLQSRTPQHPLERDWGVGAEVILSAISRSSDLTKRGVRGIIAEAIFERSVLANLKGWTSVSFVDDRPYDFMIRETSSGSRELRIQVKLQRMKKQQPMQAHEANRHYPKDMYVVEVQKTRGGIDLQTNEDTRPYRFGEFDILAVNMHPLTRDWSRFFFAPSDWLIPRHANPALIEIFQPVSPAPNDVWTNSLETCIEWITAGDKKKILDISPELLIRRVRKPKSQN